MTKKIAVINDLSGFGRCSLTAAISVISAMGIQACPLPTAILTAQTGYPHYYLDDYTDKGYLPPGMAENGTTFRRYLHRIRLQAKHKLIRYSIS